MRKRRIVAGALITAGIVSAPLLVTPGTPASADPASQDVVLPGLNGEVEISVDTSGVPHIYADDNDDLFFAQGVNVARDRLFQIDLQRRRGLGELSEVLGPRFVDQDRATRLFLYRGDMEAEWASYGPDARSAAERFTAGINAYIDWLDDQPGGLPPEFEELGYEPGYWEPEDVVRIRSNGLIANVSSEVQRARVACEAGIDVDRLRIRLSPEHEVSVPEGLDPCSVPADVLSVYYLATTGVNFNAPAGTGSVGGVAYSGPLAEGSNSWAVSPERTSTGRPILAGDPHRALNAPSLRSIVHLSSPEMDVIGAGEPTLPGVSMGHNGTAAFGLTIFGADQQDLYVYELDPDDPSRYRYGDGWEEMTTITEEVPVAGEDPRTVELAYTRHGPVIRTDEDSGLAFAVRSTWSEPGTAAYFGGMKMMEVTDFEGFREVMSQWGGPPLNFTYADTEGDIGWSPGALIPERSGEGYDGLLPVPGDGRYEWDGFLDGSTLPSQHNPERGFVATANEYNMPEDSPVRVGYEWPAPYRHERISDVLADDDDSSLATSTALQSDKVDVSTDQLLPLLEGLEGEGSAAEGLELLRAWDREAGADSAGAALYETWFTLYLGPQFFRAVSPELAEILPYPLHPPALTDALWNPDEWLDEEDPEAARDRILLESLGDAYDQLARDWGGEDPAQWRWGNLQSTTFNHPLSRYSVGPFERGGTANTVDASSYTPTSTDPLRFAQVSGASFKMVLDVGDWDNSQAINTPGQSGDPRSPHYDDLVPLWRNGEYFPLHYTREAVDENTEEVIVLRPEE
ncbi:penicillin acylase family protein [Nocardiopsis sediminis]|uniref:Penicillin acylase family protein n=1 Tax=Nocardiopsis sediminis TaxID=1778267 RepID=A0ABV8FS70_9ACTN